MREWMRKGLAWCLAAVLLLGLLPLSPRATAAEERDLSQAEIDLDAWFYRYDKSPKKPVPTVRLDGTVVPSTDYTVSYDNNTNAGQAAVTVKGTGAYVGSKTVHFTIDPRLVLPQEVTVRKCYKSFDGTTDARPEITASSLDGPLTVTCSQASYDTPYAGTGKTVTLSGMRPSNANYTMQESDMTWDRGEIAPGIPNVKQNIQLIQGERIDLDTLVRGAGAGDVTYQFSGDSKDCVLSGSQLTAGETLGSVSLIAHIAQGKDVNGDGILDYTGGTETFSLTVVARKTQPSESGESGNGQQSLTLKGGSQVTYGKSLQFTLSGGAGSGAVRYWVKKLWGSRGSATIDQSGRLTATQAGKVLVYAEKAGDATYAAAKANPIEVTIQPAQLTICVQDKTAAVGEWVPSLSSADYTVSGLVNGDKLAKTPTLSYASVPDMSREGSVTIQASGAVVPVGGNYRADITYQFGTLTITPQPVYPITVRSALNGTVTADKQSATEGTSVTLTVKPNQNFKLEKLTATSGSKTLTCRETGSGTYAFTMPAGAVTVFATFAQVAQPVAFPFTDVSKSSWYYDSVAYVYAQGLMNGTGATTFAPATPTTRGMLVTILYRMEGSPASAAWSPFADVTADAYYAAPVAWAAWNGIVNGVSATKFAPKQWITREQMASILYRYARYKQWDVSQRGDLYQFSDRSQCHSYALEALSWANATGLIQGKGKDILDPRGLRLPRPGRGHLTALPPDLRQARPARPAPGIGRNSHLKKIFKKF